MKRIINLTLLDYLKFVRAKTQQLSVSQKSYSLCIECNITRAFNNIYKFFSVPYEKEMSFFETKFAKYELVKVGMMLQILSSKILLTD